MFSVYRDHNDAVHVIFGCCDDFGTSQTRTRIGGAIINWGLSDTNLYDDSWVWNIIKMSEGKSRRYYLDRCGIIIFNYNINDTVLPPLRDSVLGFILAHEIGHALGMTHVCNIDCAVAKADSTWYWHNFWHHFGNVMYPRTYLRDTVSSKFGYFYHVASHFLVQSMQDSNDWEEAVNPADTLDLNFKQNRVIQGYVVEIYWVYTMHVVG